MYISKQNGNEGASGEGLEREGEREVESGSLFCRQQTVSIL